MLKLRYRATALSDLQTIKKYLAKESGSRQIAINYLKKIRIHCQKLAEFPGIRGIERPELKQNLRSTPFENYVIFFEYREHTLDIIAVIEGHRDMGPLFRGRY